MRRKCSDRLYGCRIWGVASPSLILIVPITSINNHPMGSELQGMNRKIRVNCMGTADISSVEVVKNNYLLQAIPGIDSCLDFSLDDGPEKVEDFYYIRVTQTDGEMAWSSPIWVTFYDHLHHL